MHNGVIVKRYGQWSGRCCVLMMPLLAALPVSQAFAETYDECILRHVNTADGSITLNEIRARCAAVARTVTESDVSTVTNADATDVAREKAAEDLLEERITLEKSNRYNPFVILPHKPNYLLPLSYTSAVNYDHIAAADRSSFEGMSHTEVKFQVSLKAPVVDGLFNGYGDLYVAYTNTSWWQAYNSSHSSPFRETNHEPEAFILFPTEYQLFGMDLKAVAVGISHQSNGRARTLSRSWNRVYAQFLLEKNGCYIGFKPWWRIPEDKKENENDAEGDDNPDIAKYMGYGELRVGYKMGECNLGVTLRNNLRSENKGAVQLDWSFPLNKRFRGYVQYFNGYGESLIDYNSSVSRLSVGIMLTDWL